MTIAELLNIHTNTITPVLDTAIVYAFMASRPAPAYDPFTDSSYTQLTDTELYELTFYVYDHLGNTRVTYEPKFENGIIEYAIKGVFDYYPYGKTLRQYNIADEKYLSTQHERDAETGFDYRGARFYDADVARFLSLDPHASNYSSTSDYVYILGNPISFVDSDGKDTEFYSDAGDLLYSSKDGLENAVTIIPTENLEQFTKMIQEQVSENLEIVMTDEDVQALRGKGTSYMVNGMIEFYEQNSDDIDDNSSYAIVDKEGNSKPITNEHGTYLYESENSEVRVGNENFQGTANSTVFGEQKGKGQPTKLHTHPSEGKIVVRKADGSKSIPSNGPSSIDAYHKTINGNRNVIVGSKKIHLYGNGQKTITVERSTFE